MSKKNVRAARIITWFAAFLVGIGMFIIPAMAGSSPDVVVGNRAEIAVAILILVSVLLFVLVITRPHHLR